MILKSVDERISLTLLGATWMLQLPQFIKWYKGGYKEEYDDTCSVHYDYDYGILFYFILVLSSRRREPQKNDIVVNLQNVKKI